MELVPTLVSALPLVAQFVAIYLHVLALPLVLLVLGLELHIRSLPLPLLALVLVSDRYHQSNWGS